jgi:hypothetical protein
MLYDQFYSILISTARFCLLTNSRGHPLQQPSRAGIGGISESSFPPRKLDFAGPSIICADLQSSAVDSIQKSIQAAVAIANCETAFRYIAWTPLYILSGSAYELYTLPFIPSPNNTSYSLNDGSLGLSPLGNGLAPIPATFYAATYPNMTDENWFGTEGLGCKQASGGGATNPLQNITVIKCELHNSSYRTSFSFINGEQTVDITMDKTPLNSVSHIFVLNMTSPYGPLANYSNGKPIA